MWRTVDATDFRLRSLVAEDLFMGILSAMMNDLCHGRQLVECSDDFFPYSLRGSLYSSGAPVFYGFDPRIAMSRMVDAAKHNAETKSLTVNLYEKSGKKTIVIDLEELRQSPCEHKLPNKMMCSQQHFFTLAQISGCRRCCVKGEYAPLMFEMVERFGKSKRQKMMYPQVSTRLTVLNEGGIVFINNTTEERNMTTTMKIAMRNTTTRSATLEPGQSYKFVQPPKQSHSFGCAVFDDGAKEYFVVKE